MLEGKEMDPPSCHWGWEGLVGPGAWGCQCASVRCMCMCGLKVWWVELGQEEVRKGA